MTDTDPKLLIVDDNKMILKSVSMCLNSENIPHLTALSAEEALSLCETNSFEVIISDIGMPKMDGLALGKIIRDKYPNTHLLAFTGSVVGDILESVNKIYDNSYVKPGEILDLIEETVKVLGKSN